MLNRFATLTALAALAVAPALAQQSTEPRPSSPAPTVQQPAQPTERSKAAQPADTKAAMPSMTETFLDAQTSDQWLASKLIGVSVTGTSNEKIGSINDLLLDKDGKILAAVIGVGGFLGIGEKNVAVSFESAKLMRSTDGDKVVLQVAKADLEKAPDFKAYQPPRPASPGPVRPSTQAPRTN
jgi:hypothetical protein